MACVRASDGAVIWGRNILKDFRGSNPAQQLFRGIQ
jgi:hypothetical protein